MLKPPAALAALFSDNSLKTTAGAKPESVRKKKNKRKMDGEVCNKRLGVQGKGKCYRQCKDRKQLNKRVRR